MLVDSLIIPECVYRPGTFTGLMTVYESNYIKLHNLTTAFDWPGDVAVSSTPRDSDLHATITRPGRGAHHPGHGGLWLFLPGYRTAPGAAGPESG